MADEVDEKSFASLALALDTARKPLTDLVTAVKKLPEYQKWSSQIDNQSNFETRDESIKALFQTLKKKGISDNSIVAVMSELATQMETAKFFGGREIS